MAKKVKCGESIGRPHEMDEILEKIWTERERQSDNYREILAMTPIPDGERWLSDLEKADLVSVAGERVRFTPAGEKEAEQIIRRHRLTERLFADVFNTTEDVWEREACELEHQTVLVEEAVDAVCAFLGHPPTCPHGRAIPRGTCCAQFQREVRPFVIPLTNARVSKRYRIVFIVPKKTLRLDRLAILGILPGSEIRVHQRKPSFVIRSGETDVALDTEIVKDIYVRRIAEPHG